MDLNFIKIGIGSIFGICSGPLACSCGLDTRVMSSTNITNSSNQKVQNGAHSVAIIRRNSPGIMQLNDFYRIIKDS